MTVLDEIRAMPDDETEQGRRLRFINTMQRLPAIWRRAPSVFDLNKIRRNCTGMNAIDIDSLEQFVEFFQDLCQGFAILLPEEVDRFDEPWKGIFHRMAKVD